MRLLLSILILLIFTSNIWSQENDSPLKVGVIGLTHTHVHWILGREDRGDIEITAIIEPNRELAQRYADMHGFSMDIVYDSMEEMLNKAEIDAATAFGSIYEHLEVVEVMAPKGIHVMVEKPLAVSLEHAKQMAELADEHDIHLLTNYETTWYPTNHKAYEQVKKNVIGDLRKVVVHDGHKGPIELGINQEFLDWLTDPVLNGAGALTDFGCYGANLITWLMDNQKPESVFAVTKTNKPDLYPEVDDEATIILNYPKMQGIIQASWNWPIARKDMEVYGVNGQLFADNRSEYRYQVSEEDDEIMLSLSELERPYDDPFSYFAAVIKGEIKVKPSDLSALENNLIVVEILDAAKESARTGKVVKLRH